jgi:hypothetical protein
MYVRLVALVCLAIGAPELLAQTAQRYAAPRTAHGHPDFQGVWVHESLTMVERPPGVDKLVVDAAEAQAIVAMTLKGMPAVIDPDVAITGIRQLATVNGEYRTSVIVDPKDGRMPFSKAGLDLMASIVARNNGKFDHPEERPFSDRCLESLAAPPIRSLPITLPHRIVQTRDYVVIASEGPAGLRIVRLNGRPLPDGIHSIEGHSLGLWERDTLVIRTTGMRDDDPSRTVLGRPLLLSRNSRITERFTRVSPSELVYRYTVEDPDLYTQPWSGEFSLQWHEGPIYEYACHEANYSMPNMLRGGQAEAARQAEAKKDQD